MRIPTQGFFFCLDTWKQHSSTDRNASGNRRPPILFLHCFLGNHEWMAYHPGPWCSHPHTEIPSPLLTSAGHRRTCRHTVCESTGEDSNSADAVNKLLTKV